MTTVSIAELFKIDGSTYFGRDVSAYRETLSSIGLADIPEVKEQDTFIGIEVEMENVRRSLSTGYSDIFWFWKSDGSLRNSGTEAISWPLKGQHIRYAVKILWDLIQKASFGARTSIHIHVDVRQLTQKQLTAILLVYLSVESLLYKFVGRDRHENIYCVPLYTTTIVNSLVDFVNKTIVKYNFSHNRYAGLNLDALRKFGTLEFRQMHGTHDVKKVVTWINLIFKIFQYAAKNDFPTLLKTITELNTNSLYIAYINEVFEEIAGVLDLSDVKSDLEKGVKAVKQSIISNRFATELKNDFTRSSPAARRYHQLFQNGITASYFSEEGR